jgi:signal transduction histidine kinase
MLLTEKNQILPILHNSLIIRLLLMIIISLPLGEGWGGVAFAQNKATLDSLHRLLAASQPDTNRVNLLNRLSQAYTYSSPDTAIQYSQKALTLARQLRFTSAEAYALSMLAFNEGQKTNYVAIRYAQQALQVATQGKHLLEQGRAYTRLADIFRVLHYSEESLDFYKKAENIFLQLNNQERLGVVYGNTGNIYRDEADLATKQTTKDSLNRLALGYFEKGLNINRTLKRKSGILIALTNIAYTYQELNQDSLALTFVPELEQLAMEENDLRGMFFLKFLKAKILLKRGQIQEAEALALEGIEIEKKIFGKPKAVLLYELLSDLYVQKKDYAKAYQYRLIHQELKNNELYNAEAIKAAQQLRKDLEAEKEEALRQEAEKERQIQRLYWLLVGGFVLLMLFILALVYRNNLRQKQANRQLYEKNEEITQQSEELQQQAEELHQQAEELAAQRDNLEKANENVMLLSEIGKKITSSLQFKTIFGQLYDNINQLMDATIFGVGIYQPDKQQISYELAMEKGVAYLPYTRSMQDKTQLPVQSIEQKKEIVINDMRQEKQLFPHKNIGVLADGSKAEEPQSLIYIPLLNNQEKVLGVMSVQSYQKDAYNDYHLNILRNLAIYTSIAIENAENLQALDEEKKNLESTNQELEALTEELRQQSDMVQFQRDQLSESSTQLEELLEESQSQKEILEIRNQEMEALQSTKDLMISAVNHDLRNPLNPILNYSQPDYPKFSEKERLAMIHDRAKMMFALINDIMDVYRADKMQLQPQAASLHKAVNEAIVAISEAKTSLPEIINAVPEDALAVFEYKYIERVFENLLSNAIKYSKNQANGGKIEFRASPLPPPKEGEKNSLPFGEGRGGAFWRISITDNGIGIPKEKFEEIFLPFSNPNAKDIGAAKSVGIGLTFCKTILEAHDSQIKVESEENVGTTFYFELPLVLNHQTSNTAETTILFDIPFTEAEQTQKIEIIAQIKPQKFQSANLRRFLQKLEVGDSAYLQNWKNALLQAKEQGNEESFDQLLEI